MVLRSGTDWDCVGGSGGNHNNDCLPDRPIHPTHADVLARQTWLLRHLVNQISNMGNNGNQGPREEPQVIKFGEFFGTNPPIFCGSKDPLDADFWHNAIEEKLKIIKCDQYEKVLFAAH